MENNTILQYGNFYYLNRTQTSFAGSVYNKKGLCPALTTMQGGGREPMIVVGDNNGLSKGNTEY